MFVSNKNIENLVKETNDEINKLNNWFSSNKLKLNIDKTCYSIFSPKANERVNLKEDLGLDISLDLLPINQVRSCTYLGMEIDDEIKWKNHINKVIKKIIRFVGIFYKIRNKIPAGIRKQLYFALVL